MGVYCAVAPDSSGKIQLDAMPPREYSPRARHLPCACLIELYKVRFIRNLNVVDAQAGGHRHPHHHQHRRALNWNAVRQRPAMFRGCSCAPSMQAGAGPAGGRVEPPKRS